VDLGAGAVHQHEADVQAVQDRDVQQQVVEIFRGQDRAVNVQHKQLVPKPGDVTQDATQIGCFHGRRM
jgi:hypothetical protein